MKTGVLLTLTCDGCGESFEWITKASRTPRWCSERCRKRASYGGTCKHCGAVTNGSNGPGTASDTCSACYDARCEERNERIFEAWNRDEDAATIGEREGMTPEAVQSTVDRHRRLHSRSDLSLHRKRNREDWAAVERLFHEGLTYAEMAERLGCTIHDVGMRIQTMREAGIDLPYRNLRKNPRYPDQVAA